MTTTSASTETSTHRPVWALWGGLGITIGGALLLAATVVEYFLSEDSPSALVGLFTALFLGSTLAHALAMIPLAGGRTGANGAVGASLVGRVALLGFGAVFMTNQFVYYAVSYAMPTVDDYSGTLAFTLALGIGQLVLLLVGSIIIVRAGVAVGAARWALLSLTGVAVITGAVANATDSYEVATLALLCSTGAQIVVGLVFMATRSQR